MAGASAVSLLNLSLHHRKARAYAAQVEALDQTVAALGLAFELLCEGLKSVIESSCHWEGCAAGGAAFRSEEHTSELQSLMRISYAVLCVKQQEQQVTTKY